MEKISLTIKEVTEKSGKKGSYWSVKGLDGKTYNAQKTDFPALAVGDTLNVSFNTQEYEYQGKNVSSRWLVGLLKEGQDAPQNVPTPKAPKYNTLAVDAFLSMIKSTAGHISAKEAKELFLNLQKELTEAE